MSINKFSGHMRSIKLYFAATVLTLSLKAKIFEIFVERKFWRELRTRPTFDRCVGRMSPSTGTCYPEQVPGRTAVKRGAGAQSCQNVRLIKF